MTPIERQQFDLVGMSVTQRISFSTAELGTTLVEVFSNRGQRHHQSDNEWVFSRKLS